MKRLVLGALAVLLTAGALAVTPVYACTTDPYCVSEGCEWKCGTGPYQCNWCTGACRCL